MVSNDIEKHTLLPDRYYIILTKKELKKTELMNRLKMQNTFLKKKK